MNVYQKLNAARLELQSRKLSKSGHNKFAGYSYFELGDFLPAIQEIFAKQGLCGIVTYGTETARLTIVDTGEGGSIEITSPMSTAALKGCHEVQNLGAVQTYIRRYLWVTAMEIVEHDALDSSKPIEEKVTQMRKRPANYDPKAHIPAMKGIGDTLTDEERQEVEVAAYDAERIFKSDGAEGALEFLQSQGYEGDALAYLQSLRSQELKKALKQLMAVPA